MDDLNLDNTDTRAEAVEHMRLSLSETSRTRAQILADVGSKHIQTDKDATLSREFDVLIEMAAVPLRGKRTEGCALVVIGDSGAGKTTLLDRIISKRPELQTYHDRYGIPVSPLISIVAPSPCTLKQLGRELLRAMGYPLKRDLREHMVWELVRQQLKVHRVMFVHIDEMQHAVITANEKERQKMSDILKNIMQQPDWPVSFILSGITSLSRFISRDVQLMRRCRIYEFENLTSEDADDVEDVVRAMVTGVAGLNLDIVAVDAFVARLIHAAYGRFGVVIQLTRGAIEQSLFDEDANGSVTIEHFAAAYARFSGCKADENVFTHPQWQDIHPSNAFARERVEDSEARPSNANKNKGRHK